MAGMPSRFPQLPSRVLRYATLAGVVVLVAGCVTLDPDFEATALRKPVMPTVQPPPEPPPRVALTDELYAAAILPPARQNDFSGALRKLGEIRESSQRLRVQALVVTQLAEGDPRLAAEFAIALPENGVPSGAIEIAARALAKSEPAGALAWAVGMPDTPPAGVVRRTVAGELVVADPEGAVGKIGALPAGAARDDTLGFAAASWARRDELHAVAWLRGRPDDPLRQRLTSAMGFEIAQTSPERAIALAETLPGGRNRWLLIGAIAQTWVATDARAAMAWARKLPAGESREAAFAGAETGLGLPVSRRPVSVPTIRNSGPRGLGGSIAPEEASSTEFAAWRALQGAGLSRDEAILEYVRQRGGFDSGAMGQWLTTLPGGATRERAMEIYLEGLLLGAPAAAADWLRTLPRSDRSDDMVEQAARRWLLIDPDAAAAWLLTTPLPPDRKEWLLRQAGR